VGGDDQPGPAVGLLGGADAGSRPAEGLFEELRRCVRCRSGAGTLATAKCRIIEPLRLRFSAAMLTAFLTGAVSAVVEKVRATTMREKQSRIAQQYTLPSRAGAR
jgi:hypothetical protein